MSTPVRGQLTEALEHELAMLLRRVRRDIGERAVAVHPDLNPTSYSLLITLADHGPHRAADLAEMFSLDKGAVSRVVSQLESIGFLQRTPDPSDGRASILAASDTALARLDAARAARRVELEASLTSWEPADIGTLAEALARFNATLSE
jgi:DNA-binding MarR family transcriptional regulator